MSKLAPTTGRIVHYVSQDSPVREDDTQQYASMRRAAVIAEVGAWITVATTERASFSASEGRPIRDAEQWFFDDACVLAVINPTGLFFGAGVNACRYDAIEHTPGTWHWPEYQ